MDHTDFYFNRQNVDDTDWKIGFFMTCLPGGDGSYKTIIRKEKS